MTLNRNWPRETIAFVAASVAKFLPVLVVGVLSNG